MNAQQTQSVEIESLRDSVQTLADQYALRNNQLDAIASQLNNIPAFGLKYGDTVAHIAIPLIIALFAFAFAYMFSVITRINQKYDSESISKMFKRSGSYRCYIGGSIASIIVVILYGLCTLIPCLSRRETLMTTMSWICFLMAGTYAFFILRFVRTCLVYDDHYAILSVIGTRYRRRKKNPKSLGRRDARLIGLCNYAIRTRNNGLLDAVLSQVNEYDRIAKEKSGKNVITSTLSFYESIVDSFSQTPKGGGMERALFWYWQQTFRRDELPSPVVFSLMLSRIVNVVKQGRYSIFDVYVEQCRYGYNFINRVPAVKYIIGQSTAVQEEADGERLLIWSELRETHFLAASYLFSIGYYEVAASLKKGAGYNRNAVYPSTLPSILKLYVDCKETQDESGVYHYSYWPFSDVLGDKYDRDILEKYTALALLLAGNPADDGEYLISEKKLDLLLTVKDELIKYGRLWLSHPEILQRFPQIRNIKIDKQIEEGLKKLSTGKITQPQKRGKNIRQATNIFELKTTASEEIPVRDAIISIINTDLADGLDGIVNENKNEAIAFGTYTFLVAKHLVLTPKVFRDSAVFENVNGVFHKRYLYILYEAISQMKIKDVKTTWNRFEKLFLKYVGDKGEQFAIIDLSGSMKGYLDKLIDGKKWEVRRQYIGAYYYDASRYLTYDLIRNEPLLYSFSDTLIVIRFADLPSLVAISDDSAPTVTFANQSDKDKGRATVRITVDPCLEARYCKDAEVLRIRIKP